LSAVGEENSNGNLRLSTSGGSINLSGLNGNTKPQAAEALMEMTLPVSFHQYRRKASMICPSLETSTKRWQY